MPLVPAGIENPEMQRFPLLPQSRGARILEGDGLEGERRLDFGAEGTELLGAQRLKKTSMLEEGNSQSPRPM
jgi:hypothetical protein